MKSFIKMFRQALVLTVALMVLCSVVYPLALTGVSQAAFNKKANGSIIEEGGVAVGSELIGQNFTDSKFFHGRLSSVSYNTYEEGDTEFGGPGSGTFNYGPSNPALKERVEADMATFLENNPDVRQEDIPTDLLTASGSGLDPHVSPAGAQVQVARIAAATGLSETELNEIIANNTNHKVIGVLGEETVNVLKANLEIAKKIGLIS